MAIEVGSSCQLTGPLYLFTHFTFPSPSYLIVVKSLPVPFPVLDPVTYILPLLSAATAATWSAPFPGPLYLFPHFVSPFLSYLMVAKSSPVPLPALVPATYTLHWASST